MGYASAQGPQTTCRVIFPLSFPVNVFPFEVKGYRVLLLDGDVYIKRGCNSEKHAKKIKKMTDDRLKRRLQKDDILVVPAAFDMVSAKIIEKEGFEAVYLSGLGSLPLTWDCPMPIRCQAVLLRPIEDSMCVTNGTLLNGQDGGLRNGSQKGSRHGKENDRRRSL